jgi:hypothetical protein
LKKLHHRMCIGDIFDCRTNRRHCRP